jgi:hypothetical protein
MRRFLLAGLVVCAALAAGGVATPQAAQAQYGVGQPADWNRFYHYPYVYYPENFGRPQQYDNLYYRYPTNRRIPVYNKLWYNPYMEPTPYYKGNSFKLDVF